MRILFLMVCALLVLAACGDGDSPFVETPTASPTVASATQAPNVTDAPTAPSGCEPTQYEVQDGDLLGAIADRFGVSVEEIAEASDLEDPDVLSIGQQLTIPCPEATPTPTAAAEEPTNGA